MTHSQCLSRVFLLSGWCVLVSAAMAEVRAQAKDETHPENDQVRRVDPAAWGADHVGKPLPAYVTGDECLFCHRTIGAAWSDNPHQTTVRPVSAMDPANQDDPAVAALRELANGNEFAEETEYLMGSRRVTRFLKRSSEYGKLELLSTMFVPAKKGSGDTDATTAPRPSGELKYAGSPHWEQQTFADRCAGCHATAVDATTRAFSALSLDCYTCHGDVDLEHTKDVRRVLLSGERREPRTVVSLCGQCHLRGGTSKSSGLPYPNTFVAGDNLFRDFQVDFSDAAIRSLAAADRHIWLSSRDMAVFDRTEMHCLTCHDVHGRSADKHRRLERAAICGSCHVKGTDRLRDALLPARRLRAHSPVCDY